jgi:hypothetical protein
LDTSDASGAWTTIGVSENIIESSWQALLDGVVYGLLRAENNHEGTKGTSAHAKGAVHTGV